MRTARFLFICIDAVFFLLVVFIQVSDCRVNVGEVREYVAGKELIFYPNVAILLNSIISPDIKNGKWVNLDYVPLLNDLQIFLPAIDRLTELAIQKNMAPKYKSAVRNEYRYIAARFLLSYREFYLLALQNIKKGNISTFESNPKLDVERMRIWNAFQRDRKIVEEERKKFLETARKANYISCMDYSSNILHFIKSNNCYWPAKLEKFKSIIELVFIQYPFPKQKSIPSWWPVFALTYIPDIVPFCAWQDTSLLLRGIVIKKCGPFDLEYNWTRPSPLQFRIEGPLRRTLNSQIILQAKNLGIDIARDTDLIVAFINFIIKKTPKVFWTSWDLTRHPNWEPPLIARDRNVLKEWQQALTKAFRVQTIAFGLNNIVTSEDLPFLNLIIKDFIKVELSRRR